MALLDLTEATFRQAVDRDGIVVLDFWAPWCGPCKLFSPLLSQAASLHADILFGKINVEEQPALAQHFNIRSVPTLMVLRDHVVVFNQAGALLGGQFESLIVAVRQLDMQSIRTTRPGGDRSGAAC